MENLPILNYRDLRSLWTYGDRGWSNGNVADDASLEVMLRIEECMRRLQVMGDDDRRYIWIRLKAPRRKADRFGEVDQKEFYWTQVLTAHYKDFHYLLLVDSEGGSVFDLRSAACISDSRDGSVGVDVKSGLVKLEEYVKVLVDRICTDPVGYNEYVAQNLPYGLRHGRIARSALNAILPEAGMFENREKSLDVLSRQSQMPIWHIEKMTLRTYMRVWRIAYEAYRHANDTPSAPEVAACTDEEVFMRHNSKGSEIKGLDWDSEEDFLKWESENSPYHCNDVAYARVFLWAVPNAGHHSLEGLPESCWYFALDYRVSGYSDDMITILDALMNAGVNVKCDDIPRLRRMAEETDYVGITPNPNKCICLRNGALP